jgi:hypothetical protein
MANQLSDVLWMVMPKLSVRDGLELRAVDATLKQVVRNHMLRLTCKTPRFALEFPCLKELHLRRDDEGLDLASFGASLNGLTTLMFLESLDVRACRLHGDEFEAVSRIGTIRRLRIASTKVDLGFLSAMTQLQRLVLDSCGALGGRVDLSGLVCLQVLKLTYVRQIDAKSIERLPALRRLKVEAHDVGAFGQMTQLQRLTVGCRAMDEHAFDHRPYVPTVPDFSNFKHIVRLSLRNVRVPLTALKALTSLARVKFAHMECNLGGLPATVRHLVLQNCRGVVGGGDALEGLQYYRVCGMDGVRWFDDGALAALAKVKSLRTLEMMSCSALRPASMSTLHGMTQLRRLALHRCGHTSTEENVASLAKMTWLSELGVGARELGAMPRLPCAVINLDSHIRSYDVPVFRDE